MRSRADELLQHVTFPEFDKIVAKQVAAIIAKCSPSSLSNRLINVN